MSLANGGGQRTLEGDIVAVDRGNCLVWNDCLAVLELWGDIDGLPLDGDLGLLAFMSMCAEPGRRYLCGGVDILDGLGNLRANTIAFDQSDGVFTLEGCQQDSLHR